LVVGGCGTGRDRRGLGYRRGHPPHRRGGGRGGRGRGGGLEPVRVVLARQERLRR
jgi:hypothetical protein